MVAMGISAKEIAQIVQGEIIGDPDTVIYQPGRIEDAREGDISFLANLKYESFLYSTKASIILVASDFVPGRPVPNTLIKVQNVYEALATMMNFFQRDEHPEEGISSLARVDSTAVIGTGSSIGPYSVIGRGAVIGENAIIYPQVYIGSRVVIGKDVCLYPGVRIYSGSNLGDRCVIHANTVVGSDGFGFISDDQGVFSKMPQLGNVIIENDVEIGANTVIDRASIGSTIIRSGVKLDNLIQIGHNVEIGPNSALAAQAGVAGSSKVGAGCRVGGQAGIVGHIKIGDRNQIQAQSGVTKSTKNGTNWYGSPALDYNMYLKAYAGFKNLPSIIERLHQLEKKVDLLENPSLPESTS